MKKILLKYGLTVLAAAAMVFGCLYLNNYSSDMALLEKYKCLTNAFSIAGVMLLCVGAMVWVSTTGFFDGIGYALKHMAGMLVPGYFKVESSFADYKTEMADKRKSSPVAHLIIVGAVCMVITMIFLSKFNALYGM